MTRESGLVNKAGVERGKLQSWKREKQNTGETEQRQSEKAVCSISWSLVPDTEGEGSQGPARVRRPQDAGSKERKETGQAACGRFPSVHTKYIAHLIPDKQRGRWDLEPRAWKTASCCLLPCTTQAHVRRKSKQAEDHEIPEKHTACWKGDNQK